MKTETDLSALEEIRNKCIAKEPLSMTEAKILLDAFRLSSDALKACPNIEVAT